MNRLLTALAAAACVPALVHAAQKDDLPVPRGLAIEQPAEPSAPAVQPSAPTAASDDAPPPRPPQNERAAQRDRDLRQQCLDLPTNKQVNACAERYRPHGSAKTASAKKAPPSDAPKADAPKADAPKDEAGKGGMAAKPPAAKPAAEPPRTGDIQKLPPLKPIAPDTSKAAAPPVKASEPTKK